MLDAPSEVFYYADGGAQSDAIRLSTSSTVLQAAKKDLLVLIQLQVNIQHLEPVGELAFSVLIKGFCCRTPACWRAE